ncbi:putative tyrosine protein phosphatase MIH1 Ecym_2303 [Eremothecium cymbalariae DBVPG|uniref:M-phase inducer phosphatase n=1 Tax=Eremothecium cymbalariae (strain CBS 270.75 / DBVPG 7215 / KCTC 17166 / NRRL Y-17582) TaxID=931890 RepID=G8JQ43_ERECY|nr:Hypothetical protein Ecym_2303 [Eremothecium cymbalariae DBVPG\
MTISDRTKGKERNTVDGRSKFFFKNIHSFLSLRKGSNSSSRRSSSANRRGNSVRRIRDDTSGINVSKCDGLLQNSVRSARASIDDGYLFESEKYRGNSSAEDSNSSFGHVSSRTSSSANSSRLQFLQGKDKYGVPVKMSKTLSNNFSSSKKNNNSYGNGSRVGLSGTLMNVDNSAMHRCNSNVSSQSNMSPFLKSKSISSGSVHRTHPNVHVHRRQLSGSSLTSKKDFKPSHCGITTRLSQSGNCKPWNIQSIIDSDSTGAHANQCNYRKDSLFSNGMGMKIRDSTNSCSSPPTTKIPPVYHSRLAESAIPYKSGESTEEKLPRITVDVLVDIMDGKYSTHYHTIKIVDCRFEYEFQGGHIKDAVNVSCHRDLENEFIHKSHNRCSLGTGLPPLVVFHCEFSSYRGPLLASHLRNCDRILNYDYYPSLYYPDILILEGGFKSFFEKFPEKCNGNYVGMDSNKHHETELAKFKKESKMILTRQNSVHIFQNLNSESPTNPVASASNQNDAIIGLVPPTERLRFSIGMPPSTGNCYSGPPSGSSVCSRSSSNRSVLTSTLMSFPDLDLEVDLKIPANDNDDRFSFHIGDEGSLNVNENFPSALTHLFPTMVEDEDK